MDLLSTGDKTLAESSSVDKYWGTGKAIWDENAFEGWEGENKMGKALMRVREIIQH